MVQAKCIAALYAAKMSQSQDMLEYKERAESEDSYERISTDEIVSTFAIDEEWEGIQCLQTKGASATEKITKQLTPDEKARSELIEFYRQRARQSAAAGKECKSKPLEGT